MPQIDNSTKKNLFTNLKAEKLPLYRLNSSLSPYRYPIKQIKNELKYIDNLLKTNKPRKFAIKNLEISAEAVLNDIEKKPDQKIESLNKLLCNISKSDIEKIKETYNLDENLTKLSESIHNQDIRKSKAILNEIVDQAISILYPEQNK